MMWCDVHLKISYSDSQAAVRRMHMACYWRHGWELRSSGRLWNVCWDVEKTGLLRLEMRHEWEEKNLVWLLWFFFGLSQNNDFASILQSVIFPSLWMVGCVCMCVSVSYPQSLSVPQRTYCWPVLGFTCMWLCPVREIASQLSWDPVCL